MEVLGCFFLLIILAIVFLLLAPVILMNYIRNLLGLKSKKQWRFTSSHTKQEHHNNQQSSSTQQKRKDNKKIFERNEGEYVDFEEIKE